MATKKLTFEIDIAAPAEKVWRTMLEKGTYEQWTAVFSPGSTYEGSWEEGSEIRFLGPEGGGMIAEIAENRPQEFISIRHLGMIENGQPSEQGKDWFPTYENYTFTEADGGTHGLVEVDMAKEYEEMFTEMWPQALKTLKEICEA